MTSLDLKAVEDMCHDIAMSVLMEKPSRKSQRNFLILVEETRADKTPDWVIAALNCKNDSDILPMAMWVYLSDWKKSK